MISILRLKYGEDIIDTGVQMTKLNMVVRKEIK